MGPGQAYDEVHRIRSCYGWWFSPVFKYLLDLPEMAALVRGQHTKCAIDVVAEASIDRRFDLHLVNRKASCGFNGLRQLDLRLQEGIPRSIKVTLTRNQRSEHFEPKPVWWLQITDEQPVSAPVRNARLVVRRGARAMASDIAGRNALVVWAKWSRHCATDHDVGSKLVVSSITLLPATNCLAFRVARST